MQVSKSKLVSMFLALGYANAAKWDHERLSGKLAKVAAMDPAEIKAIEDEGARKLATKLRTAIAASEEIEIEDDGDEAPVASKAKTGQGKTPAKGKKTKPGAKGSTEKASKKGGVIASIVSRLQQAGDSGKPITKAKLVEFLLSKFSDRKESALMSTINTQVPSRLKAEKNIIVQKNEKGYWIDGSAPKKKGK